MKICAQFFYLKKTLISCLLTLLFSFCWNFSKRVRKGPPYIVQDFLLFWKRCDQIEGHPNSVNTMGFRVSFSLFSLVINLLHASSGNMSIIVARNAWVNNFICLCVMENRNYVEWWMVEATIALKEGLRNWGGKVR